jgi:hypothetical protein
MLSRKQFSARLSFSIAISKSQGHIISNVAIYLPRRVFSHCQLYVTLSRGVSQNSTKVLIKVRKIREDGEFKKMFFKDFFIVI